MLQFQHITIHPRTKVEALLAAIHASQERGKDVGQCIHSIAVKSHYGLPTLFEMDVPWEQIAKLFLATTNLHSLDVAAMCEEAVPASCFSVVWQVAGTAMTALAVVINKSSYTSVITMVAQMTNLCHLRLEFDWSLPACPFDDVPPLILPNVHYMKLKWYHTSAVGMLRWFACARFRRDCELHLIPMRMSKEESEALNPWFEAHHSQCVHIQNTQLSERSSIMQHAQRVDFGRRTLVPTSLFSSSVLPERIRILVNKSEGSMNFIKDIHRTIIESGQDRWHSTILHLRAPKYFSWNSLRLGNIRPDTPFTPCVDDMNIDELGSRVIDQAGYLLRPDLEDLWPNYEDYDRDGPMVDSDTESESSSD
jgi:hypothetical protein